MDKKKKIKIAAVVISILAVIAVIIGVISANSDKIQYSIFEKCMPESAVFSNDEVSVTIYRRENPNFSEEDFEADPLSKYEFFYKDKDGTEKSVIGANNIVYDGKELTNALGTFMPETVKNLNHIKLVAKIIAAIVIVAVIIAGIVIWFILWSKNEDRQKQQKYKNTNNKNNK